MIIDWGNAVRIGLVGFSVVFFVLVLLAVAIWLIGKIVPRFVKTEEKPAMAKAKSGANNSKKGE